MCSVGDRPAKVIVRGLVAWIAERREIEFLMPIDKAIFRMVSKSSGRNEAVVKKVVFDEVQCSPHEFHNPVLDVCET